MRRVVSAIALAVVVASASIDPARAEVVVNERETIPVEILGCTEFISGEIVLHTLFTSTVNGNNISGKFHFQPQGGTLVGLSSGDAYRPTGVTQGRFSGSLENGHYSETFVNNFRIIGPGPGNNLLVHDVFHVTVNAKGEVTVVHSLSRSECR